MSGFRRHRRPGAGGAVRSEHETAAASSVTVVGRNDSRAQASPAQNGSGNGAVQVCFSLAPGHCTWSSIL